MDVGVELAVALQDALGVVADLLVAEEGAGRDGETSEITELGKLKEAPIDMFCTVIIGNSSTKLTAGRMVTPRGAMLLIWTKGVLPMDWALSA